MITIQKLIRGWAARFEQAELATPIIDARALALFVTGLTREELIADPDFRLTEAQIREVERLAERRLTGEPIAYLVGQKEFWGLTFKVTPETLIPRPDTETLVEMALAQMPDKERAYRLLDLGTGSGCLLLALLSERAAATGVGVDLSQGAIEVAQENAQALGLSSRARFCQGNWTEGLVGAFDLVVSNPPYIADDDPKVSPEVRAHEPASALFGGPDGLDPLRAQAPGVRDLLTKEGSYIMEYGQDQTDLAAQILQAEGFEIAEIRRDLAGIERAILAKVAKM